MKVKSYPIPVMIVVCALVLMRPPNVMSGWENILLSQSMAAGAKCPPTPPDYLGPFYKANATERTSVGSGYELAGVVKSAEDCAPIKKARIEFWLTNPDGEYDDDHRATLFSDPAGNYRFESNFPPGYSGRPPHIHIKISAEGFKPLATQHYPVAGSTGGILDIVLIPTR